MTNGGIIKAIRKQQGITQVQLAREIRVSKATLVNIENDEWVLEPEIARRISDKLGVNLLTLVNFERRKGRNAKMIICRRNIGKGKVGEGECNKCGHLNYFAPEDNFLMVGEIPNYCSFCGSLIEGAQYID